MPLTALRTESASRRSPVMNSRSSPSRWKRGLACRTSARTGKPAWSKVLATADPTKPLAPVIKTAVAALTRFRFPIAPELRIEHLDYVMSMFKLCSSLRQIYAGVGVLALAATKLRSANDRAQDGRSGKGGLSAGISAGA